MERWGRFKVEMTAHHDLGNSGEDEGKVKYT